ncbi:MAG: hypothetical protein CBC65_001020 [Rhodothermaceae bacterium TMED105]|nr:MAG: hypothetical protein CBC65_001020 [Rhodothermaceae bacterium TMED105]|tara:strand:+ start:5539 stop:6447 length:909 start_codon:yes stop_codon:yes gene_type:complete
MKTGFFVGVPLTLLQLGVHTKTGAMIDPSLVGCNFLLGHAIYDADRMTTPLLDPERTSTRIAAAASTVLLASHEESRWAAPLVPLLHFGYTPLKPLILAPVKPFFVAAAWTAIVYYVPLSYSGTPVPTDMTSPASVFLLLSTLSHALDIVDIDEDTMEGTATPAVRMERKNAKNYMVALSLATSSVYLHSPIYNEVFEALFLISILGAYLESVTFTRTALLGFVVVYALQHDVEFLSYLLRSTEISHKVAIEETIKITDLARQLPHPWKRIILESTIQAFKFGDFVGSKLIHLYELALRGEL